MSSDTMLAEFFNLRRILTKRRRTSYIRDIFKNRESHGELFLLRELEKDPEYHQKCIQMTKENFEYILEKIWKRILHPTTQRYPISARMRLALTLRFRYLATGASHTTLGFNFRISAASVGTIVREVLEAIWIELSPEFLPTPTEETWKKNAEEFLQTWNFPNCCGALDGKHVRIKNFHQQGYEYHNYKKFFSTNLLACCVDASYKFTVAIVGSAGSESDAGILEKSDFGSALFNDNFPLRPPCAPPENKSQLPFVFLGDQGFLLKYNLLRPFPLDVNMEDQKKVFNYRLSRARRVVENGFGIIAARWRIFHVPIDAKKDLVLLIIKASIVLNNCLMARNDDCVRIPPDREEGGQIIRGSWRETVTQDAGFGEMGRLGSNNSGRNAQDVRTAFMKYFSGAGSVAWQTDHILRGNYN